MIVEWTNELLIATAAVILVFLITAYLVNRVKTRSLWRFALLAVGFGGIWWMLADVGYFSSRSKGSVELSSLEEESISAFLASDESKTTDEVVLSGNNFDLQEMKLLRGYKLRYVPDSIPSGFVSLDIPEISENEEWALEGSVNLQSGEVVGMTLPNGSKVDAGVDEDGRFSMTSKAPTKGLYEYKLFLVRGEADTLEELLPIQVREERKLSMLLLADAPQFELNYFKNYWKDLGYGLVQKVRISQAKFSTSFMNMPKLDFSVLTEKVVGRFDIIMLDMKTWNSLTSRERNVMLRQMEDRALAVVLRINEITTTPKGLPRISVREFIADERDETLITTAQFSYGKSWSSANESAMYERGYGKLLVVGEVDTYKWLLNDKKQQYQSYWAGMLSELYLRTKDGFAIEVPFLVTAGKAAIVKFSNLSEGAELLLNDDGKLPMVRIPFIVNYASAQIQAEVGWNKVSDGSGSERWFYAHDSDTWEAMRQRQVVDLGQFLTSSDQEQQAVIYDSLLKYPWWMGLCVMVFGFGLLWLDEKLYS